MVRATLEQTARAAKRLGVNLAVIPLETLHRGVNIELEHGSRDAKTNVTNDSIMTSLKIACAHLQEFPDYYDALDKMEAKLKKKWSGKKKPSIFEK